MKVMTMKKLKKTLNLLLSSLLLLSLLVFFLGSLGCKVSPAETREAVVTGEEPITEASLDEELKELDDLDELEQAMAELEEEINLEELAGLELE